MTSDAQSEYLEARLEWDDRFAGQRKSVRVLTGITIVSLAIGLLGLGYGI
jgi:type IV secretory pathway TrbF-like protein